MNQLKVHDWDIWQTYRKDRGRPPWIKVHRILGTSQKWSMLSDAERGQLVSLWIAERVTLMESCQTTPVAAS